MNPLNLFVDVSVHDPANPTGRTSELSWWPAQGIKEQQEYVQQHFLEWPGTRGPIHIGNQRKGELETLGHLYEFKSDADSVAAILIAASLFARLRSSRRNFPADQWPPFSCVEAVEVMAYHQWQGEQYRIPWADTCTVVLPYNSRDWDYKITDVNALVRYLADEHAAVFSQYRPVVVNFSTECDAVLQKRFKDKKRVEAEQAQQWEIQWRERHVKREQERLDRLKAHPRCEEWEKLPPQELGAGIKKPPPGFWARVEAGKIPHPNGSPSND